MPHTQSSPPALAEQFVSSKNHDANEEDGFHVGGLDTRVGCTSFTLRHTSPATEDLDARQKDGYCQDGQNSKGQADAKMLGQSLSDCSLDGGNLASSPADVKDTAMKLTKAVRRTPDAPRSENHLVEGWPAWFLQIWLKVEDTSGYSKAEALPLFNTFNALCATGVMEIHKDDLLSAVHALGYLLSNERAIKSIADEVTRYSTLNFENFLKFSREYHDFERSEWQSHFDRYDDDNSGTICVKELRQVMMELGYTPLRDMLHEALKEVDQDGSGTIDLDEYIRLMDNYRRTEGFLKAEYLELEEIFKKFDRDRDGSLCPEEVAASKRYLDLKGCKDFGEPDVSAEAKPVPVDFRGFLADMRRCREAEIRFFQKQFREHDSDGSGSLSTTELPKLLEKAGYIPLRKALGEAVSEVDQDCSGEVDFDEFLHMMQLYKRSEGFTKAEVEEQRAIFKKFDVDETDAISVMELSGILSEQGYVPDMVKLQNLCHDYDVDGSGDIGFREFLKIIRRFREKDLRQLKELFWRFDKDGSGTMATEEIASLLLELGYEVSRPIVTAAVASVDKDGSGEVDWEEFIRLMDAYRTISVQQQRRKCDFDDKQIEVYREIFDSYDTDRSENIEPKELIKVLSDLNMQPRSRSEQQSLVALMADCRQKAGEEDESKITFWVFLRLMRTLEDDQSRESLAVERRAAEAAKFSREEVREFRDIFYFWIDDLIGKGDGSGCVPGIRALTLEGLAKMLKSLGLTFTAEDRSTLNNLVLECDHNKNRAVDFPDFLVLMRKLLDVNFAGIKEATKSSSTRQ